MPPGPLGGPLVGLSAVVLLLGFPVELAGFQLTVRQADEFASREESWKAAGRHQADLGAEVSGLEERLTQCENAAWSPKSFGRRERRALLQEADMPCECHCRCPLCNIGDLMPQPPLPPTPPPIPPPTAPPAPPAPTAPPPPPLAPLPPIDGLSFDDLPKLVIPNLSPSAASFTQQKRQRPLSSPAGTAGSSLSDQRGLAVLQAAQRQREAENKHLQTRLSDTRSKLLQCKKKSTSLFELQQRTQPLHTPCNCNCNCKECNTDGTIPPPPAPPTEPPVLVMGPITGPPPPVTPPAPPPMPQPPKVPAPAAASFLQLLLRLRGV